MESCMNQGHHNNRQGQAFTDEEVKALLAAQMNHLSETAEEPDGPQQPLPKQPYGYGETSDSDIADMIDDLLW